MVTFVLNKVNNIKYNFNLDQDKYKDNVLYG